MGQKKVTEPVNEETWAELDEDFVNDLIKEKSRDVKELMDEMWATCDFVKVAINSLRIENALTKKTTNAEYVLSLALSLEKCLRKADLSSYEKDLFLTLVYVIVRKSCYEKSIN